MESVLTSVAATTSQVDELRLVCCKQFSTVFALGCIPWIICFAAAGLHLPAVGTFFCFLMCLLAYWLARVQKSTYAATNVLCGASFAVVITNSVLTGGWESPLHYFLISLPVTSMLLVGWSNAMAWTFIALAGVCGLYLLEYSGVRFPPVPAPYRSSWEFILELSLFVVIFILIWIYQRLLSLVLDIKDRQALLLQSSLKRRQEFLAHVTHEIRTPVHGMLAMTKMLSNRNLDSSQQQQYIENMQSCGDMLLRLVNNVLDLSSVEAGCLRMNPVPVLLRPLVNSCYNLQNVLVSQKSSQLRCELRYAEDLPEAIVTDGVRVLQILVNLIGNAVKFTDSGLILLAVRRDGPSILFEVEDTGAGIPENFRPMLFVPFRLLRPSEGTGIGLSLSKMLADLMGGSLTVEHLPVGSRFGLRLPLLEADAKDCKTSDLALETRSAATAVVASVARADFSALRDATARVNAKILLVEDNKLNQVVALKYFRSLGYPDANIWTAMNGAEAVELSKLHQFDVILMDCQMPVMNGWDATRLIRSQPNLNQRTKICAVTASSTDSERVLATNAGMDTFLVKPFSQEQLDQMILRCVSPP
jgi:signal transduction histidine kinase/CheY-like chemotaxis protein